MTTGLRLLAAVLACALPACSDGVPARPRGAPAPVTTAPAATGTPRETEPAAGPVPAAFARMPAEYYGTVAPGPGGGPPAGRSRLAAFDSATGRRLRWLTSPPAGHDDTQAAVVEDTSGTRLVFVRQRRDPPRRGCYPTRVLSVPAAGGAPAAVLTIRDAAEVYSVGVDRAGTTLAYTYQPCPSDDVRPWLRVVSLSDGRTVMRGRSTFEGNGVVGLHGVTPHAGRLVVAFGIHLQSWITVLDVRPSARPVALDMLPALPMPDGCHPGSVLWEGTGAAARIVAGMDCAGERWTHENVEYRAPAFAERHPWRGPAGLPGDVALTGTDGRGHLIGVATTYDAERTATARRVVQVTGDHWRELPACAVGDAPDGGCAATPIW